MKSMETDDSGHGYKPLLSVKEQTMKNPQGKESTESGQVGKDSKSVNQSVTSIKVRQTPSSEPEQSKVYRTVSAFVNHHSRIATVNAELPNASSSKWAESVLPSRGLGMFQVTDKKASDVTTTGKDGTYRLLLVGCVGAGKSSVGNTILGEDKFKTDVGMGLVTRKCQLEVMRREKEQLEVVDTPGFCDRWRSDEISTTITQFLAGVSPGPHAVLVVMKVSERFNSDIHRAYAEAKMLLGEGNLASHMILVFTGSDLLKGKKCIESEVERADDRLKEMKKDAGGRSVCFNNKASGSKKNKQREELLKLIRQVSPGGSYLSCPAQKKIAEIIDEKATTTAKKGKGSEWQIRKAMTESELHDSRLLPFRSAVSEEIRKQEATFTTCSVM